MGRLICRKYVVEGKLVAAAPFHIGGAFSELVSDMPLARDGAGRVYLPGTSLAGPIRQWWRQRWRADADEASGIVFGRIPEKNSEREGHASYLVVDDAPVSAGPIIETRDGVGIDRETGAAAEGIKYDREVLPIGTQFDFRLEVELASDHASVVPERFKDDKPPPRPEESAMQESLGELIAALQGGHIRFGAAKTRGLGTLTLTASTVVEHVIGKRDGLIARLKEEPAKEPENMGVAIARAVAAGARGHKIAIAVTWHPELPVMNKSEAEGVSVDALPLVTAKGDWLQPVITGAAVKGVLRAHAERICRTLAHAQPYERLQQKREKERKRDQEFLADLTECPLVAALFGSPGRGRDDDKRYDDDPRYRDNGENFRVPGLGALSVDDCLVDAPVTYEQWRNLLTSIPDLKKEEKTGAARRALDGTAWDDFRPATHVAIDRWTGAAAEGLLFSRIEPAAKGSREFRLELDLERIARPLGETKGGAADAGGRRGSESTDAIDAPLLGHVAYRQAAFALLMVTLRDLARGRVPVGFGTTRGLGSIQVDKFCFEMRRETAKILALAADDPDGAGNTLKIDIAPEDFENDTGKLRRFAGVQDAWDKYPHAVKRWAGHD